MEQNLSNYKIFYTVATIGNISKAAKELYISQPAISKSILKLEASLSVTLFHRSSRGVTLTNEGSILYESIKVAFTAIKDGEENIKKITELGIGTLRLGVSTTLCKNILLPYLKEFIFTHPHIKVIIQCQSTLRTIELLGKGALDIGFVGDPGHNNDIEFIPITSIEDAFVCTPAYLEHLMVREGISSLSKNFNTILAQGNLMLLDEKNLSRIYIDEYMHENQIQTNHILQVSDMDLLIEFAKVGLGISCVIKEFISQELDMNELVQIPLSKSMKKRKVGFAHAKHKNKSLSLTKFMDFYGIK